MWYGVHWSCLSTFNLALLVQTSTAPCRRTRHLLQLKSFSVSVIERLQVPTWFTQFGPELVPKLSVISLAHFSGCGEKRTRWATRMKTSLRYGFHVNASYARKKEQNPWSAIQDGWIEEREISEKENKILSWQTCVRVRPRQRLRRVGGGMIKINCLGGGVTRMKVQPRINRLPTDRGRNV